MYRANCISERIVSISGRKSIRRSVSRRLQTYFRRVRVSNKKRNVVGNMNSNSVRGDPISFKNSSPRVRKPRDICHIVEPLVINRPIRLVVRFMSSEPSQLAQVKTRLAFSKLTIYSNLIAFYLFLYRLLFSILLGFFKYHQ